MVTDGYRFEAGWVVVSKSAHYGDDFGLMPDASLGEAAFRLCIFPLAGPIDLIGYLLALGHRRMRSALRPRH